MANLLDVLAANIPLYLQSYPLTQEEQSKIQEKKAAGRDIREQFPPVEEIQTRLREILKAFIENSYILFLHLHSQKNPFCLRAIECIKENAPQAENQQNSISVYVISKKTMERAGKYKCVRLAVDLRTLKEVAKVQCRSEEYIDGIRKEFSHLQKLQPFQGFCRLIHSEIYQHLKMLKGSRKRPALRTGIYVEWLKTDLTVIDFAQLPRVFQFDEKQIYFIMQKLLEYLIPCHEQGIVLRDIKLENVMLKEIKEEKEEDFPQYFPVFVDTDMISFAKPKISQGTLGYMPPEILLQFTRDPEKKILAKPSWDMWAFGWILFYLYQYTYVNESSPFLEFFKKLESDIESTEGDQAISIEVRANQIFSILQQKMIHHPEPQTPFEELISRLLRINPQERLTAKQALEFFQANIGNF